MKYLKQQAPQWQRTHQTQIKNRAGGFVQELSEMDKLRRFLILGSETNTFYASSQELLAENVTALAQLKNDPEAVDLIVKVSDGGLAAKNEPAIFALAYIAANGNWHNRNYARSKLHKVIRIGTHMFQFMGYYKAMNGKWSTSMRNAVNNWMQFYRDSDGLAYQMVKYQQREGWSWRDVLRLAHPTPINESYNSLFRWATGNALGNRQIIRFQDERLWNYKASWDDLPEIVRIVQALHESETIKEACQLIVNYRIPRECVPTELLRHPEIWEALLVDMPATALIRNLGKMSSVGLTGAFSGGTKVIVDKLGNDSWLNKSRIHPITVLNAWQIYSSGHGLKGSLTWKPDNQIIDALDAAFYTTFQNVEPTNLNHMLAIDTSGSMAWAESQIAGMSLRAFQAAAALAMVTFRVEPYALVTGFSGYKQQNIHNVSGITQVSLSPSMRLNEVIKTINRVPSGGTDCSLPMRYAIEKRLPVDVFTILTDNDTWAGPEHPWQSLDRFRQATGRNAKVVVVGMVANHYSIAQGPHMMDVVGFDPSVPAAISAFVNL